MMEKLYSLGVYLMIDSYNNLRQIVAKVVKKQTKAMASLGRKKRGVVLKNRCVY